MANARSILLPLAMGLSGCGQAHQQASTCPQRKLLGLYINNDSIVDTVAQAHIELDDSVLVDGNFTQQKTGSEYLYKNMAVCSGPHYIKVNFGRYQRDTLLTIKGNQSLIISMNHDTLPGLEFNNGIAIALINHDYNWLHRID